MLPSKMHGVHRVDRLQHGGSLRDADNTENRQHEKPYDGHRAEQAANAAGAVTLDQEETTQDADGDGYDQVLKLRRCNTQAFDRRKH